MKTWLKYWHDRWSRFQSLGLLLLTFTSPSIIANPLLPGLFESLDKIIQQDASESSRWNKPAVTSESVFFSKVQSGTNFFLAPEFLQSVLLNATKQQLAVLGSNHCALADYAWLDLLRHGSGKVKIAPLIYAPGKAEFETLWISRITWAKFLMSKLCPKSQEMAYFFSAGNLQLALSQVVAERPRDEFACKKVHQAALLDPKTPYYCYLVDAVAKGDLSLKILRETSQPNTAEQNKKIILQSLKVKEWLGNEKLNYLDHLCQNLASSEKFCEKYFADDYWVQKAHQKEDWPLIEPFCSTPDIPSCAQQLAGNPSSCMWSMPNYPSLMPRAECDESSKALNFGRLNISYRDCPARVENISITNAGRILLHFDYEKILSENKNKKFISDEKLTNEIDCSANVANAYLDFTTKIKWTEGWNSQICFVDQLQRKNYCAPYLLFSSQNSIYSVVNVVSTILKKTNRMDKGYQCSLVNSSTYDPKLLKFRSNCWIIIPSKCGLTSCPIKVVVDDREQRNLFAVQGEVTFPYHNYNKKNSYNNFQYNLERELGIKSTSLNTLQNLLLFFEQKPKGIIHGVGCAEELLPEHFQINSLGQCQPIPFIVDGAIKGKNIADVALSTKTSVDEVASPRLIPWQQILSAVESYQRFHPQNLWSLYGLYR